MTRTYMLIDTHTNQPLRIAPTRRKALARAKREVAAGAYGRAVVVREERMRPAGATSRYSKPLVQAHAVRVFGEEPAGGPTFASTWGVR